MNFFPSSRARSSRTAVLASLGAGYLALAACGEHRSEAPVVHTTAKSELVAEVDRYAGGGGLAPLQLALTFDDGPSASTAEISTYLKSEGIRAVFFVNGARIQATQLPNPNNLQPVPDATGILAQLAADGHLVANHTTTHRSLADLNDFDRVREIAETDTLLRTYAKTPWNRSLIRPPAGGWNAGVVAALQPTFGNYVGPITPDIGTRRNVYPKAADDSACFGGGLTKENGKLLHSEDGDAIPDGFATSQECADGYLYEIAAIGRGVIVLREGYSWSSGDAGGNALALVKALVPPLKASGFSFVRADQMPAVAADLPACSAPSCGSCSGPGADDCIGCPTGSYLANGLCAACTQCPAGTFTATACTETLAPACTPCPANSYSAPNAETCTSCAACDDHDDCTADTCSAALGCAHAPIAGCGVPPSTGDASVDPPPAGAGAGAEDDAGCNVSARGTGFDAASLALSLAALAWMRRGRRRHRSI